MQQSGLRYVAPIKGRAYAGCTQGAGTPLQLPQ